MDLKLTKIITVAATTTAQDVVLGGQRCKIQNTDDTNIVYFREKIIHGVTDAVAATATNSMVVFPKETTRDTMLLDKISVLGSGSASVRILVFTVE